MNTLNRLPSLLYRILTWPLRVAAQRRDMTILCGLDDRELADIGLSRQDLRDATALPVAEDPTDFLAVRAWLKADAAIAARRPQAGPARRDHREPPRIAAE